MNMPGGQGTRINFILLDSVYQTCVDIVLLIIKRKSNTNKHHISTFLIDSIYANRL